MPVTITVRYLIAWAIFSVIAVLALTPFSFPIEPFGGDSYNGFDLSESLISKEEIMSGGPPRDGIPAILNPKFVKAGEAAWLEEGDLVAGVAHNGEAKAYPLRILLWHEAVNDAVGGAPILVSYCPLCASTLVYRRKPASDPLTFGISGLLHQSNVLFYDHQTESLWSQLEMKAVSGEKRGTELELFPSVLATWAEWKERHPRSLVLSRKTGFLRNYDVNPYLSYENSSSVWFPVGRSSDRYPPKEKILVVSAGGDFKAYPFSELQKSPNPLSDEVGGRGLKIHYNDEKYVYAADGEGEAVKSFVTYWFAWYAFKPDTEVYVAPR